MPAASLANAAPDHRSLHCGDIKDARRLSAIMAEIEAKCREAKARTARRADRRSVQPANLTEE